MTGQPTIPDEQYRWFAAPSRLTAPYLDTCRRKSAASLNNGSGTMSAPMCYASRPLWRRVMADGRERRPAENIKQIATKGPQSCCEPACLWSCRSKLHSHMVRVLTADPPEEAVDHGGELNRLQVSRQSVSAGVAAPRRSSSIRGCPRDKHAIRRLQVHKRSVRLEFGSSCNSQGPAIVACPLSSSKSPR
jgi:hypothetical protein